MSQFLNLAIDPSKIILTGLPTIKRELVKEAFIIIMDGTKVVGYDKDDNELFIIDPKLVKGNIEVKSFTIHK